MDLGILDGKSNVGAGNLCSTSNGITPLVRAPRLGGCVFGICLLAGFVFGWSMSRLCRGSTRRARTGPARTGPARTVSLAEADWSF